jgi:hypothetical protein
MSSRSPNATAPSAATLAHQINTIQPTRRGQLFDGFDFESVSEVVMMRDSAGGSLN